MAKMEQTNPNYTENSIEMAQRSADAVMEPGRATYERNKPLSATRSANAILDQMPSRMHQGVPSGLTMDRVSGSAIKRSKTKRHHRGHSSVRMPKGVNLEGVASSLLDDPDFVDGTAEDQNEDIKQLPLHLRDRRAVRDKIKTSTRRREGSRLSCWKIMKYSISLKWKKFQINLAEATYSLELWRGHIKTIEGKFGTGVTSYFLFLKWLILLNVPLFLILFCLLVLPQILYNVYHLESQPDACYHNATFTGAELLTGQGWFLGTVLYYGCYLGDTIRVIADLPYNMEYAYLFVIIAYYILTLIAVLYSLTKAYKKSYIDSSGTMRVYYVVKVLSGWDHNITNIKTAKLRQRNVAKEFQEYLETIKDMQQKHTFFQLCCLAWFRIVANMGVLIVLGGSGYLVWYLSDTQSLKSDIKLWNDLALPFTVSAINYLLPFFFSILTGWERYKNPRTALYLTMLRTMTLYCVTLGVIVAFWMTRIECSGSTVDDSHCRPRWENFLGHQMYKLVVMDFLFTIGVTIFSELIMRLLSQCCKRIDKPQFDIGRNTLYLVYPQALVWIGAFYSPLLPILVIIKFIIVFYMKRFSVVQNCAPPKRAWRGVHTHMIIMGILLFNLLLCSSSLTYSIVRMKPSQVCGPYQRFNTTYGVITQNIDQWRAQEPIAGHIIDFVTSNEFLACILIALCVVVYYTSVMADGLKEMVTIMDKQIRLEGEDKLFLLKLLQQIGASRPPSGYQRSMSMPPEAATPRPMTPSPTLSGRRRFAKYAIQDRLTSPSDHTPPGSPRMGRRGSQPGLYDSPKPRYETPLRARRDSPVSSRRRVPTDFSHDGALDNPRLSIVGTPSGPSTPEIANPSYAEGSPTSSRPNLPYPAGHYDLISPESQRL
nr:Tmc56 [Platynereis dumerilii]